MAWIQAASANDIHGISMLQGFEGDGKPVSLCGVVD